MNAAVAQSVIAWSRASLGWVEAFTRGLLCNTLVCLARWLCLASRRIWGKNLCITIPGSAFAARGFEYSIANTCLISNGQFTNGSWHVLALLGNLIPVTLGNIIGGGGSVKIALVCWTVYLHSSSRRRCVVPSSSIRRRDRARSSAARLHKSAGYFPQHDAQPKERAFRLPRAG